MAITTMKIRVDVSWTRDSIQIMIVLSRKQWSVKINEFSINAQASAVRRWR